MTCQGSVDVPIRDHISLCGKTVCKGVLATSLFLELVSVPTEPCFSISTVEAPSLACNFRAIANPTTPPPITACVKSAFSLAVAENCRLVAPLKIDLEKARVGIMTMREGFELAERSTGNDAKDTGGIESEEQRPRKDKMQ